MFYLKLAVERNGHEIEAAVISFRYGRAPAMKAAPNELRFEWLARGSPKSTNVAPDLVLLELATDQGKLSVVPPAP